MSETSPHIELYTDGACSGNPGPGGWAYILKHPATGKVEECSGSERETTNNRMEIMAVIQGLESLKKPCHFELYSDSQYVIYGLDEWLDQYLLFRPATKAALCVGRQTTEPYGTAQCDSGNFF